MWTAARTDPPIAGLTVYFKVWDVDDPFDQLNPSMQDVSLIDANATGPDNRGPEAQPLPWSASATTDAEGMARVTFTVSMQPGNNYRAAASLLADALSITQLTQTKADAVFDQYPAPYKPGNFSGYSVPATWSPMLTVWRKLHVETDSMARPTFAQNTFTMPWNEPRSGSPLTQVVLDVNDPPIGGGQTDSAQFTGGRVQLQGLSGTAIVTAKVIDYVSNEGPFTFDDTVTINLPACAGGQSGLACLGSATGGTTVLSDDDLQISSTFDAKAWGCDDSYANPAGALAPPDLSLLLVRYSPAYIEPVYDVAASGTQGLTTFLRNVTFSSNQERALWDQALAVRNLPVSTSSYWTVMVVSAWQAEEAEDADPDSEDQVGSGVTKGINTHYENVFGDTATTSSITGVGNYTGVCAVFKAVFGESVFTQLERYTVVHEIGHTFGLDHSDEAAMCRRGDCQTEPFSATSLMKLREYHQP